MNPEAIEAAAKAIFFDNPFNDAEDGMWEVPSIRDHYCSIATAALEAAAPFLIREARAAELETAADGWQEHILAMNWGTTYPVKWLRARAAAVWADQ